jgi:hypothetical protein
MSAGEEAVIDAYLKRRSSIELNDLVARISTNLAPKRTQILVVESSMSELGSSLGSTLAVTTCQSGQLMVRMAGGHKMTDDEIREALRLDFEQTADWRRSKAAEYPEDSRNLEAAALLDKLAASVETVAPDLLDAYGSLRDDYMDSEQHSEMFRQIGFHSWPETAEDFVKACIADRAMGA